MSRDLFHRSTGPRTPDIFHATTAEPSLAACHGNPDEHAEDLEIPKYSRNTTEIH